MLTHAPVTGKTVQLMATCLCDAFFDDVAQATVQVLERVGCEVQFPEAQTCCGQPAFNAGDWNASRKVVRHTVKTFAGQVPIIVPSGSCAAMMFHGAPLEFEHEPDLAAIHAVGSRTWELADFLVYGLGITEWKGRFPHRVAFHRSCHSRGTQSGEAADLLLSSIEGLELVKFGEGEQCCGFGGAFSVTFPHLSADIGQRKIEQVLANGPEILISADMGCLLHLGGIIAKDQRPVRTMHLAQLLRDAME